jgi:hypothetical protein
MTEYTKSKSVDQYLFARQHLEQVINQLQSSEQHDSSHGKVEALIQEEGRELQRLLMQAHLDDRATHEKKKKGVVGHEGAVRPHCRDGCKKNLTTIFGKVVVQRKAYSGRQLKAVFPMDKTLNLPVRHKYSACLQRLIAELVPNSSFEDTSSTVHHLTGNSIGKRQIEELTQHIAQDFDSYYQQRTPGAESPDDILVMTCDGKGIVMRKEDLREATRKAGQGKNNKLEARLSKGEKRNRKRMAMVAATYDVAPYLRTAEQILGGEEERAELPPRPKPTNKRVWASVEADMESVIEDMVKEALRRDPTQKRTWLVLVDGSEPQLRAIQRVVKRHQVKVTIVQDFVHVLEYLWKAAYCFNQEGSKEAEEWVKERALGVLQGRANLVAAGIRRSATRRCLSDEKRKAADKCANYLLKNKNRLAYDKALQQGWPIATGVIEGACRYLIKDRMDITGARWSLKGAEAVLRLRALHAHGEIDQYMEFHQQQELLRNYEKAA